MNVQKTLAATAALGAAALALRRRPPAYDFGGRSVVITGGSRGLGLLLARELAAEGARLALLARDGAELGRAAAELRGQGAKVLDLVCDVRDRGQVDAAISRIAEAHDGVDVLVNNAGVIQVGPIEHMTAEDFEESLAVHFWGPLYATLAALPHLRRRPAGRIVNIASIGGKMGVPHLVPYCAGKFALVGLSEGLHHELWREGIRVTTVCPGLMRTGSHVRAQFKGQGGNEFDWFALSTALPVTSMDGRRAARQIVEACRRGDAELVITTQARLAVLAKALVPEAVALGLGLAAVLLPGPNGQPGDDKAEGRDLQRPAWLPRLLTLLVDRVTRRNNEGLEPA
jgi:NAD(P)-dependent dehydrogenase (short-subunit alcohol dehydrogenase family)